MFQKEIPQFLIPPPIPSPNLYPVMTGDPAVDEILGQLQEQNAYNWQQLDATLQAYQMWLANMAAMIWRYGDSTNAVINGQIEFPTPSATEHSGNIKVSYVQVVYDAPGAPGDTGAIQIRHGYGDGTAGQIPRGWFQMAQGLVTAGAGSGKFIDQILASNTESPNVGGYPSLTVTAATTLTGTGAFNNGWVGNDIRVGDEVKVIDLIAAPPGTVSCATGTGTVVGAGGTLFTSLKTGWLIRSMAAGSADRSWHVIDAIDSDTAMTITPLVVGGWAAGSAYEVLAFDRTWKTISAVTLGAPGNPDELTLSGTGTEVPVGAALCDYTIRRPMTDTFAWIRMIGAGPIETTLAFY